MHNVLKLSHPMRHGPAVRRLQELGDLLGFDRGENDGIFGPATERVVMDIQNHFGLEIDGVCGPKTWEAINGHFNKTFIAPEPEENNIIDMRHGHDRPRLYARKRDWGEIEGVTLHQTGCDMPDKPQGWIRLNAHLGVTTQGTPILVNDPTDMIWHAQGLSKTTIGIEVDGNYHGTEGNPHTLWAGGGPAAVLTDEIKAGLDIVFEWLVEQFEKHCTEFKYIRAHRQSKNTRSGDPGSAIWSEVALPWIEKLGLDYDPGWHCGSGYAIPRAWDLNSHFGYWER